MTLSTGWDRKNGTKKTRGTVRVVCANTLAYSIAEATKSGKLRSISAATRLEAGTLKALVEGALNDMAAQARTFDALANTRLTDEQVGRYFADVLEINFEDLGRVQPNGNPLVSAKARNQLGELTRAYGNAPGATLAAGSAWGALNAVTYYATHIKGVRDTSGSGTEAARFASNLDGDAAGLKARALQLAANSYLAVAA